MFQVCVRRPSVVGVLAAGFVFGYVAECTNFPVRAAEVTINVPGLTSDQIVLRDKVTDCLDFYYYQR